LGDYWNLIDFTLIIFYIAETIIFTVKIDVDYSKIMYCIIITQAFIKICYYLRIYDGFSFLVSMMKGVFSDLKYFLAFYVLVLTLFALLFSIISLQLSDTYGGIGQVGYLIMAFRTSTGDFEVDDFTQQSYLIIFTWIIWIIAVVVL